MRVIRKHARGILSVFRNQLIQKPLGGAFSNSEEVILGVKSDDPYLQVWLTPEEVVNITIDSRTGRITLRDTGDFAAAGRGPRFSAVTDRINDFPPMIVEVLIHLRYSVNASYFGGLSLR